MKTKAKHKPCPKHDRQDQFKIVQDERGFRTQCQVCGKYGPYRKTLHGSIMAWNELAR